MNHPTIPSHRILVASDLSGPSRHAVDRAAKIAASHDSGLTVVHVVSQGALDSIRRVLGQAEAQIEARIVDQARQSLDAHLHQIPLDRGLSIETRIAVGTVVAEIEALAEADDAGLLVVGARGEGFLRRLVLGATAERLVRRTERPVLVVRHAPQRDYRRVAVGVDFSRSSARALHVAREIAPAADLVLLHAFEVPFEGKLRFAGVSDAKMKGYQKVAERDALARLEAFALAQGLGPGDARLMVQQGDPAWLLREREEDDDIDLIAVGKHDQHPAEALLLGSHTKHVLTDTTVDVLVAGAPPEPG